MRLSDVLKSNDTVVAEPAKSLRLSEVLSEEKATLNKRWEAELWELTPEREALLRKPTEEEESMMQLQRDMRLVREFPNDFYYGVSAPMEAFAQGILPIRPKELARPGVEEAYPIAKAIGSITALIATSYMTGNIAPLITYAKPLAALPTFAKIVAGRMAQTGATFGLKELVDNMAELSAGKQKDFKTVVLDVITSTGFGTGLGAVGTIAAPVARIPAQAAYGYATAKIRGSTNFEAGVNAAIFGVFGLFNTKNLSETYKRAAWAGAKQALVDRMVAKGVDPVRAEEVSSRYFTYALSKNGGWAKATIKDFDQFSQAMRKGWKVIIEPEIKPEVKPTIPAITGQVPITPTGEGKVLGLTKEEIRKELSKKGYPKLSTPTEPPKEPPQVIVKEDLPPEEPPKFPGVSEEFLKQPKPKTTILQYFTPAEYHLKELGFDAKIGQPVREALQDFSIELMQKNEKLINIQKEHFAQIPKKDIKVSNEKLWEYMDKGIPEKEIDMVEAKIAQQLRPETEEMLKRINEVNKLIGKPEVIGVKNYILHMLKPEILNEIYAKGVIPPELAKVMEYIPNKNIFLRTAQQRKGIPDSWLTKDPYELMRAMYAIDLRYVYLQKALHDIEPYVKAVKEYVSEEGEYWSPEAFKYLDDWVKQAIKMRPSNWDILIDNLLENTIAPLLRKTGLRVSHMPWRDFVSTMSAAAHTGALGMRIRPILRNLVQSTFDWVFYGTKPYLKASSKFLTKEGFDILKKSKVWRTRMPYEAQDLATLRKIFRIGSLGYRASDLHNVGKGLLTRYYHAIDDLKMTPEEAIKWADNDLPATQWSYRREDLPRAYWTTTGRAFWTLGSWWMNFYTRFLPELLRRAFTGKDVTGRLIPTSERLGIMRLLILIGALFAIKKISKELTGTAVDYTGQIKPTPLRQAPIAQLGISLIKIGQGFTDNDERNRKTGLKELGSTAKIFIPWELAAEDLFKLLSGKKTVAETLFYTERKQGKKVR